MHSTKELSDSKQFFDDRPEYLVCSIVPVLNIMELCLITKDLGLAEKYVRACQTIKRPADIFSGKFFIIKIDKK